MPRVAVKPLPNTAATGRAGHTGRGDIVLFHDESVTDTGNVVITLRSDPCWALILAMAGVLPLLSLTGLKGRQLPLEPELG